MAEGNIDIPFIYKVLQVTKNINISTVVVHAVRFGKLLYIGGYFSNTANIAEGTTIVDVYTENALYYINQMACTAVQCDDNNVDYLSFGFDFANSALSIKTHGTLTANKYCRFFMVLPYA